MDNTTIIKNAEEKERFNRKAIVCLVVALSLIVGFLVGSSIGHINASTDIKDPHPAYDVAHIGWFDMYLVRYTIADEATRNEFGPEPYISWLGIIYLIILYSILFLFPFRKNILKNASKKLRKGIYIFTVCFLLISLVSFFVNCMDGCSIKKNEWVSYYYDANGNGKQDWNEPADWSENENGDKIYHWAD